jgi:type II secretory pathway component PulF
MSTTPPLKPTRGLGLAIFGTVVHVALVLVLFVLYVSSVPAAKKLFDEFGMTLPLATQAIIRLSNWVAEFWWALVPMFLLFVAADFGLLMVLRGRGKWLARLWFTSVSIVLGAFVGFTIFAVELPKAKLLDALAH